jgi:hypothetical protein
VRWRQCTGHMPRAGRVCGWERRPRRSRKQCHLEFRSAPYAIQNIGGGNARYEALAKIVEARKQGKEIVPGPMDKVKKEKPKREMRKTFT